MEPSQLNWIANFIWGIADDVLRDLYVRGKYRDVILPMTVLRRIDSLLESSKQAVLDMKTSLDKAGIVHQDQALRQAAGQAFYNTSKFTLRDLNKGVKSTLDSYEEIGREFNITRFSSVSSIVEYEGGNVRESTIEKLRRRDQNRLIDESSVDLTPKDQVVLC